MEAHREHIYQRLVRESKLPHVAVSLHTVLVSLAIVLGWSTGVTWIAACVTLIAIGAYVLAPRLIKRLDSTNIHRADSRSRRHAGVEA